MGIELDSSSHISIDNVSYNKGNGTGVYINGSSNVSINNSKLKATCEIRTPHIGDAIYAVNSSSVQIGTGADCPSKTPCNDLTYDDGFAIYLQDTHDVVINQVAADAEHTGGYVLDGTGTYNVTLENSGAQGAAVSAIPSLASDCPPGTPPTCKAGCTSSTAPTTTPSPTTPSPTTRPSMSPAVATASSTTPAPEVTNPGRAPSRARWARATASPTSATTSRTVSYLGSRLPRASRSGTVRQDAVLLAVGLYQSRSQPRRGTSLLKVPASVLIVSGCSAVGKSTVSRLLAEAVTPSVHLPIDLFLRLFDDPFPDPASEEGARRYETVGAAAAAAAAHFAFGGYTVILDSPMFPEGAEGVALICGRHDVRVHYAVLQAAFDTCLERFRRRDPHGTPDLHGLRSLHAKFIDLDHREVHGIDASGPAQQVADAVLSAFRDGLLAVAPSE